jgi:hypothetical protein
MLTRAGVAQLGTLTIRVTTPAPGGGTSNAVTVDVVNRP